MVNMPENSVLDLPVARAEVRSGRQAERDATSSEPFAAERMRVALLTNSVSPHIHALCEAIHVRVKEFHAFVSSETDQYHQFPKVKATFGVTVQRSFNRLRPMRRAYGYWQRAELHLPYDTLHQLSRFRPDIILSAQLGVRSLLAALYRRRSATARLILWAPLSQHTEEERHWVRRVLRRWLVQQVDGAFVNGREGGAYLRELGYEGPLFTVPYSIEPGAFRTTRYQPKERHHHLMYAGQLVPQKGIGRFCRLLDRWCASHPEIKVHLEIAGHGNEEKALRELQQQGRFSLEIHAPMPQEELARLYHRASIFVLPTLGDEWGVVVNEAMIAGLPVLGSTYSQAVQEMVEDGVCGWQFDVLSEESTMAALDRALLCSADQLRAMSGNAQRRIAEIAPPLVAQRALLAMEDVFNRA